ncbi:MAG TPA: hypothetical protein VM577_18610 [Anaerovoracaceae bacterium]|nr:hypothetical protein [Anaerovoracaceae bacterium]
MKIAVILGQFSIGARPLDFHFENIWTSSRGLTGTDLTFVAIASELRKRSHDVSLFTVMAQPHHKPDWWEGVRLYNFDEIPTIIDDTFDVVISINEPDVLRLLKTSKPLRVCWDMLNDFTYCIPGFDDFVDQWLGVCEMHTNHLKNQAGNHHKWDTLFLGCSPELYQDNRVPGRIVWTSSADRGLHWLLSVFPKIKKAVPEAHLKIFYHFNYGDIDKIEPDAQNIIHHTVEMANRLRYIKNGIARLKHLGVEHIGSVSRREMQKQFSEASVLAYPSDPVAFSEGYSVSILEGHASFTVPVITDADCLGSIYKNSGSVMVPGPMKNNLEAYTDAVIKSLTDHDFANKTIEACRQFASQRTWGTVAENMEKIIKNHPKMH